LEGSSTITACTCARAASGRFCLWSRFRQRDGCRSEIAVGAQGRFKLHPRLDEVATGSQAYAQQCSSGAEPGAALSSLVNSASAVAR